MQGTLSIRGTAIVASVHVCLEHASFGSAQSVIGRLLSDSLEEVVEVSSNTIEA